MATTIGQAADVLRDEQKLQSLKLEVIHTAVLAVGSGSGSAEQIQLLRDILAAVTLPGDPEASPSLVAIRERVVARNEKWRGLRDSIRAVADLHNPTK